MHNKHLIYNNKASNMTVTVMKFIATVFVIYIHGANLFGYSNNDVPQYLVPLKSLFECAVPAFMSISGYLLFMKPLAFMENMKKKVFRLAIPFIIWSLFWVLFELIGYYLMPEKFSNVLSWSPQELLLAVFGIPFFQSPLYSPIWYVRDLFILSIVAPIIDRIVHKYYLFVFVFASAFWFTPFNLHLREAICFFLIGAAISCCKASDNLVKLLDYRIGLVLLVLAIFLSVQSSWILVRVSTLIFLWCFCIFAKLLSENKKIFQICGKNVRYTFFVYVIHGKILSIIQIFYANKLHSLFATIVGYFVIPLLLFYAFIIIARVFQRLLPSVFAVCNGERIKI